jgi:hypothetical protein
MKPLEQQKTDLFTLVAERWYAWEMLPGYTLNSGFDPYVSPIYVKRVVPLRTGKRLLQLAFFNAAYAEGVQNSEVVIRVLKRAPSYLLASLDSDAVDSPRSAVVGNMTFAWLKSHLTHWLETKAPSAMPEPYCSDAQHYLNRRLRGG